MTNSLSGSPSTNLDYLYANARAADGSFYHVLDRGKPSVPGLAADQVYMMSALLDGYQASGDRKYLEHASSLGALVFESFRDPASGMLKNRAPATPGTVLTQATPMAQVFYDDPTPAIQAVAAEAFQTLAALTSNSNDADEGGATAAPGVDTNRIFRRTQQRRPRPRAGKTCQWRSGGRDRRRR